MQNGFPIPSPFCYILIGSPISFNLTHLFLQYAPDGHVVRGPAPLPLALAHLTVDEADTIIFSPWTETDFRTEGKPWWT